MPVRVSGQDSPLLVFLTDTSLRGCGGVVNPLAGWQWHFNYSLLLNLKLEVQQFQRNLVFPKDNLIINSVYSTWTFWFYLEFVIYYVNGSSISISKILLIYQYSIIRIKIIVQLMYCLNITISNDFTISSSTSKIWSKPQNIFLGLGSMHVLWSRAWVPPWTSNSSLSNEKTEQFEHIIESNYWTEQISLIQAGP